MGRLVVLAAIVADEVQRFEKKFGRWLLLYIVMALLALATLYLWTTEKGLLVAWVPAFFFIVGAGFRMEDYLRRGKIYDLGNQLLVGVSGALFVLVLWPLQGLDTVYRDPDETWAKGIPRLRLLMLSALDIIWLIGLFASLGAYWWSGGNWWVSALVMALLHATTTRRRFFDEDEDSYA